MTANAVRVLQALVLDDARSLPLHAIERGPMGRIYDVLAIWKERGTKVTGKGLPGGHNLQEDVPDQVLAEVTALLRT